jgi:plasmid stabilization system protein ParE
MQEEREHTKQKPAIILPECEKNVNEAAEYIAISSPVQAKIFRAQFAEIIYDIQRMPTRGMIYRDDIRKTKLGKFRYGVYYREEADRIEILGIHHERRGTIFNVAM